MFWIGLAIGFVIGFVTLFALLYLFDRLAPYGSTPLTPQSDRDSSDSAGMEGKPLETSIAPNAG